MIIAGTGHRPPKLGGYCNRKTVEEFAYLFLEVCRPKHVISGGALGWDQALAMAALDWDIPYSLYLPFLGFEEKWPSESQEYFYGILQTAYEVKYISAPGYESHKMQLRNEAMVDACDALAALWDGSAGGTRNCVYYAQSWRGGYKQPMNLWSAWQQFLKKESVKWPTIAS